jgi:hypothetical protein
VWVEAGGAIPSKPTVGRQLDRLINRGRSSACHDRWKRNGLVLFARDNSVRFKVELNSFQPPTGLG